MAEQIEFDYLITPDGLQYDFHHQAKDGRPCRNGRFLLSFTGQGMPPITYITQRGPFQHGETVLDYRLGPRRIAYIHRRSGCDRSDYWDLRADLINHLRPNRQTTIGGMLPFQLRKILPSGAKRDIDCWIQSGPAYAARSLNEWDEAAIEETLQFYCPDPTFYDPTQVQNAVTMLLCNDLIFPFDFPFIFCGGALQETDSITYTGTWLTYPTVRVAGPAEDAIIRNITTGEKLEFTRDIPDGRVVTADLRYGYKTVTDDTGANWIGALSADSDLATFHIAPDPEAPGGVNSISSSARGVSGRTSLSISFYTRYIGI